MKVYLVSCLIFGSILPNTFALGGGGGGGGSGYGGQAAGGGDYGGSQGGSGYGQQVCHCHQISCERCYLRIF